jgi:hypothetical protein
LYWNSLDSFKLKDFFVTQNKNDKQINLWKASNGEIVWKSHSLESKACSIKIFEKYRKIFVGLDRGGKCTFI